MKRLFDAVKETILALKVKNIVLVMVGTLIVAFGLSNIHAFSDITEGGIMGVTLLLAEWTGISPAISSFIINGVCYLIGWRVLGKEFIAYSAISIAFYSPCYALFESFAPVYPPILESTIACALVGAVFIGVGVGLAILGGGAPGGDDALAMIINERFHIAIQHTYLVFDLVILLLSLTYIPFRRIAYSLLTVVLSGQIAGWMQHLKKLKK